MERDELDPPWYDSAPDRATARVEKYRGAREKGIDVALALDAVSSILTGDADVVIVVSRDRDLMEIAADPDRRKAQSEHREVAIADTYALGLRPRLNRLAESVAEG